MDRAPGLAEEGLKKGFLLIALAAVTWGTTGTTLRLAGAGGGTDPLVLGASRLAVAAPLLLFGALRTWRVPNLLFLPAGLCIAAYQLLYFSAVPRAGVAATALLAICSAPVFVAALAVAALRERLNAGKIIALCLGAGGGALLVAGSGRPGGGFAAGAGLALGAGLAYSIYLVATKRAATAWDPGLLAALTFSAAAMALAPVLVAQPEVTAGLWLRAWPLILYLGAVPTAAAYWLFTAGLRRVAASSAPIVGLLEPLTATTLGLTLFAERLAPAGWAGVVLLLGAVVVLARAAGRGVSMEA